MILNYDTQISDTSICLVTIIKVSKVMVAIYKVDFSICQPVVATQYLCGFTGTFYHIKKEKIRIKSITLCYNVK